MNDLLGKSDYDSFLMKYDAEDKNYIDCFFDDAFDVENRNLTASAESISAAKFEKKSQKLESNNLLTSSSSQKFSEVYPLYSTINYPKMCVKSEEGFEVQEVYAGHTYDDIELFNLQRYKIDQDPNWLFSNGTSVDGNLGDFKTSASPMKMESIVFTNDHVGNY